MKDARQGRRSEQRVVVHHWHPDWATMPPWANGDPYPPAYECSVPVLVVVQEAAGPVFAVEVEGTPEECPVCKRRFRVPEQRRIADAAIALHFRDLEIAKDGIYYTPGDVVLDI